MLTAFSGVEFYHGADRVDADVVDQELDQRGVVQGSSLLMEEPQGFVGEHRSRGIRDEGHEFGGQGHDLGIEVRRPAKTIPRQTMDRFAVKAVVAFE